MEAVIVALIVAAGGVFGQWLLRRQEFRRQDDVADRAAHAADLLLAANERVARATTVTNDKLDVIHGLVNSNMTAAMQAEMNATVRELAMMREVVSLKQSAGHEPSADALAAIKATAAKVSELSAALDDRLGA